MLLHVLKAWEEGGVFHNQLKGALGSVHQFKTQNYILQVKARMSLLMVRMTG